MGVILTNTPNGLSTEVLKTRNVITHGGARPGAGRRQSGPDSVQVNWRVSQSAKTWIVGQAKEQGVSVAAIVDELIKTFEEVSKGYIVMQKDFSKITVDFKGMVEGMSRLDRNGNVFAEEVLDDFVRKINGNL